MEKNIQPLLSIVIPTRNRQKYCIAAIDNILSYDYSGLELCVQDNSDDSQIEEYVNAMKPDSRLVYKRIPDQIASIFNIGGSLALASGKYVILIGDDDTILPSIFSTVEYMDKNDIDSLCPIPIIDYYWPGAHPDHPEGYLVIPPQSYKYNKMDNVSQTLKRLLKRGTVRYLSYHLPKVYHGIVRRDVLEQIKNKTGHYAGGLSPDIYLSVAISSLVKNHYTSDFSVSIAGVCNTSSTGQSINKGHRGDLRDAPHFNLRGNYIWDSRVPSYYSVDTIWAESALKAIDEMELLSFEKYFNVRYLEAYSLLNNRSIFKFAFSHTFYKLKGLDFFERILSVSFWAVYISVIYTISKIKKKFKYKGQYLESEKIINISIATSFVKKYVSDKKN